MLVNNALSRFIKALLLVLTLFTLLLSVGRRFTNHVGEYYLLVLLATIGMMFLVSAENLLMVFVSLELLSLSLYILAAFNKRSVRSAEGALKYFLFGGMSAGFMLFGLSLIYGLTGELELERVALALIGRELDSLLLAGLVLTLAGFGFKVAAVPFHLWAPDAYQGAPLPSAALIASGSKLASFFILARVLMAGFAGAEGSAAWGSFAPGWIAVVAVLALLSMVLGNLAAIAQSSVRRLLAYSAIAHAGYALLGVLADSQRGMASLIYYVATYALTALGAFGVVGIVEERRGDDRLSSFAGLARRSPLLALCMLVFLLSLAGIPPLAGFFGKFYLFAAAAAHGQNLELIWLVFVAVGMSAVSLFYYLQVLKQIFVVQSTDTEPLSPDPATGVALVLLAGAILLLGCAPSLLLDRIAL
jgi:NADH-quinone oxidoreductase subunit N